MDCSGFVQRVCFDLGINSCPRTSEEQFAWCGKVAAGEEQTGDLCFIVGAEIDPSPGHVMIVVNPGNPDKVIDEPYTGAVCRYDTYSRTGTGINQLVGYGRIPGVTASPTGSASTAPVAADTTSIVNRAIAGVTGVSIGIGIFVFGLLLLFVLYIMWKVYGKAFG
jgi:hypothetical protein